MASITVNSALVAPANAHQCLIRPFEAAEQLTVGYAVYINTDGKAALADADAGLTEARVRGIVVGSPDGETTIAAGRVASVCLFGPVYGFEGMTPGAPVFNSKTAGRIDHTAPTSGAYPHAIGFALTAEILFVNPDTENPSSV